MLKSKTSHGHTFERELLLSLRKIPRSYAARQPGRANYNYGRATYVPPTIDLNFVSQKCMMLIECKSTYNNIFYLSRVVKRQMAALRKFNTIDPDYFIAVLAIRFMKAKKVVFVTDLINTKKVDSTMKGVGKVNGIWQVRRFINEHTASIRKKKQKNIA